MSCDYNCEYSCEECDVPDMVMEFVKGYNQALDDVLKLIATLGIDWKVKNSDIDWLEKSVERLRK